MKPKLLLLASLLALSPGAPGQAAHLRTTPVADRPGTSSRDVSVDEAEKLLKTDKTLVVLDVRTAAEFSAGHIPGATNVDFNAKDFKTRLGGLDREKTYLLHCQAGGRSAKADALMQQLKFKSVLHLRDGFGKWEAAGKPVQK